MQNHATGFQRRYAASGSPHKADDSRQVGIGSAGALAERATSGVPSDDGTQRLAIYAVVGVVLATIIGLVGMKLGIW